MSFRALILVVLAVAVSAQLPFPVALVAPVAPARRTVGVSKYIASIKPVYKTYSAMKGKVVIFTNGITGALNYAGYTIGAEPNIRALNCTTVGGCGIKLTNGVGCSTAAKQGESLFVSPVVSDPWLNEKYDSDAIGQAIFGGEVNIGTSKIVGKPFISK